MRTFAATAIAVGAVAFLAAPADAFRKCRPDAVRVGTVCVDKYEASVWEIPDTNVVNRGLIKAVQQGNIGSAAILTQAGIAQHGILPVDDYGAGCPKTGNDCKDFYPVSVAGVWPSAVVTWFQAAAMCRNAGKRLPTNQEWQVAALGTPDPGTDNGTTDCGIDSQSSKTGSRNLCVSDTGAFDMVGGVHEWVADWGEEYSSTDKWSAAYGNDYSYVGGNGSDHIPAALSRGGSYWGLGAGVFNVQSLKLTVQGNGLGFRCVREP